MRLLFSILVLAATVACNGTPTAPGPSGPTVPQEQQTPDPAPPPPPPPVPAPAPTPPPAPEKDIERYTASTLSANWYGDAILPADFEVVFDWDAWVFDFGPLKDVPNVSRSSTAPFYADRDVTISIIMDAHEGQWIFTGKGGQATGLLERSK